MESPATTASYSCTKYLKPI
ncbi:hypothetical protein E2C01_060720 [Portunus trituberculatus]|uniref:Uncharacterized protein n=1 Tax=Portunus trituberculatus TaxID=210409 RepID=A0A5B7H1Z1_PORTR|nr:hypothetical protein [Portunus trituberculatus]